MVSRAVATSAFAAAAVIVGVVDVLRAVYFRCMAVTSSGEMTEVDIRIGFS